MYIVYASDDNFAEIMGVSIVSLFENNKQLQNIKIFILDSGIKEKNKKRIEAVFREYNRQFPVWIPAGDISRVVGVQVKQDRGSMSQFARLFISSAVPQQIDRVLYLDCDTIINGQLEDLWNTDFQGKLVAAMLDPFAKLYRRNLGLTENDIMFNSGVMLIDLNRWRTEQIEDKLLDFIKQYKGLIPQGDQGALNAILSRETFLLAPKFNAVTVFYDFTYENMMIYRKPPLYYSKEDITEAVANPYIIHFTTSFLSRRVWMEGCKHPFTKQWLEYKAKSPWKNEPPREYVKTRLWKRAYLSFHKLLPSSLAVRISGLLQAYGRPLFIRFKLKLNNI